MLIYQIVGEKKKKKQEWKSVKEEKIKTKHIKKYIKIFISGNSHLLISTVLPTKYSPKNVHNIVILVSEKAFFNLKVPKHKSSHSKTTKNLKIAEYLHNKPFLRKQLNASCSVGHITMHEQ